jgi:hypothetical protein
LDVKSVVRASICSEARSVVAVILSGAHSGNKPIFQQLCIASQMDGISECRWPTEREFTAMNRVTLAIFGLIFIVAGALALFYRGIPYTSRDILIDAGPVTATAESQKTWPISPILGGLGIAGGVALIVVAARK